MLIIMFSYVYYGLNERQKIKKLKSVTYMDKRGYRGQRRHPPYTPYSIGNSSLVIFRIGIKKLSRVQRGCFVEVSHD